MLENSRSGKPARPLRAEREFGLLVGGVLALLGIWWWWRGKFGAVPAVLFGTGAMLVLLGASYPRALVLPNRGWMALAHALSFVSTRVILAIIFFLVVTPIGIVKRLTGWDPLGRRRCPADSYWRDYAERQRDPRHYEKMF